SNSRDVVIGISNTTETGWPFENRAALTTSEKQRRSCRKESVRSRLEHILNPSIASSRLMSSILHCSMTTRITSWRLTKELSSVGNVQAKMVNQHQRPDVLNNISGEFARWR